MHRNILLYTLVALAFVASPLCLGQQQPDIRRVMTAAEFKKAGLDRLTPEELTALNSWFGRYLVRLYNSVTSDDKVPTTGTITPAAVIETQMDGDFEGWDGETLFKLANGQIWQQASYAYTYHYAYRPKVLIYKNGATYRMKVDGVTETISVKRIK